MQFTTSTIEGWNKQGLEKLGPLYEQLINNNKTQDYLQVDETVVGKESDTGGVVLNFFEDSKGDGRT